MKKTVLLALIALLASCSDYPTSGRFILGNSIGENISVNKYSGYIVEFNSELFSVLKSQKNSEKEFFRDYKRGKKNLPGFIDNNIITEANDAYRQVIRSRKEIINQKYEEWRKNSEQRLSELKNKQSELEKKKQVFDKYTLESEQKIDSLEKKIESYKSKESEILLSIRDRTNKEIIDQELPRRKLGNYFSLNSQVVEYPGMGVTNCREIKKKYSTRKYSLEKYIVIDDLKNENKCTYINRPVKEIASLEYDEYVIKSYKNMSQYDYDDFKIELKAEKKKLKNASQIASNKSSIDYWSFNRKYKANLSSIEKITNGLKEDNQKNLDLIAEKGSNYYYDLSLDRQIDEISPEFSNFLLSISFLSPSISEADRKHKDVLKNAFNESYYQLIEKNITEVTEIDDDGEFSGLRGKFGSMVVLLSLEASLIKGNKSKPINLAYSEHIDINDENHHLAKKSELDLVIDDYSVIPTGSENRNINLGELNPYILKALNRSL